MKNLSSWIVIKFGGTSVKDRSAWNHITTILRNHLNAQHKILMVCSAPFRVSNALDKLAQDALNQSYQETFEIIISIYQTLAEELAVDFSLLQDDFNQLKQLCEGIALLQEASPRIRAKMLSFGELMLTQLGFEFLRKQFDIHWQDARELLFSLPSEVSHSAYLSATCEAKYDEALTRKINQLKKSVVITQGFIASNAQNETVVLGRGGSDTSAAYFATKISAKACEIWTDVPGIYTANPRLIPQARLLERLSYMEAQEIASLGAKVLHPLCIPPLRENQITLYVKQTTNPEHEGTLINLDGETQNIPIKAIITHQPVLLINIESVHMWKQAGFLFDVFSYFKKHHLSINLISTSESNVTVSLDPGHYQVTKAIETLLTELNQFAKAKLIGPCASISLVGREIRSILPQISHLFEVFSSKQIYLLSQAANDLNLTFVVDEDQAERLAKKLHALLIEQGPGHLLTGKSWLEEEQGELSTQTPHWWQTKQETLLSLAKQASPVYVYDTEELEKAADRLLNCHHISNVFYAMKANPHPDILKVLYHKGIHFECVSIQEVRYLLKTLPNIKKNRILFTPNFAPKEEYEEALAEGIMLTIDSLFPLQHWPEIFKNHSLFVRIDPGQGSGHHKYVCTGGNESKFGIPPSELPIVAQIVQQYQIKVIGLHAHYGSGNLTPNLWHDTARLLMLYLDLFPDVQMLNLGGGLGVVDKPGQQPLNIQQMDESLKPVHAANPKLSLWIEPGRYLVATAGVLLAKVTQVKQKADICFIGVETGMNSLIRPALYGAYHEIDNLSRMDQPKTLLANIVGPICESGDTFGYSRLLPETREGDIILIANVGAYGHTMSSHYNLRPPAKEFFLK